MAEIKAVVFDMFGTVADLRALEPVLEQWYDEKAESFLMTWREKQLQYSFMREILRAYRPFDQLAKDAFRYTCKALHCQWTEEIEREFLAAVSHAPLYADAEQVFVELAKGKRLAIFSNGPKPMIQSIIRQSTQYNDIEIISVHDIQHFKPNALVYERLLKQLSLPSEEVLFVSSNSWDIAGARHAGLQAVWINRGGLPWEPYDVTPTYEWISLLPLLEEQGAAL